MKNENKLVYEAPKAELLSFEATDILQSSGEPFPGEEDAF